MDWAAIASGEALGATQRSEYGLKPVVYVLAPTSRLAPSVTTKDTPTARSAHRTDTADHGPSQHTTASANPKANPGRIDAPKARAAACSAGSSTPGTGACPTVKCSSDSRTMYWSWAMAYSATSSQVPSVIWTSGVSSERTPEATVSVP